MAGYIKLKSLLPHSEWLLCLQPSTKTSYRIVLLLRHCAPPRNWIPQWWDKIWDATRAGRPPLSSRTSWRQPRAFWQKQTPTLKSLHDCGSWKVRELILDLVDWLLLGPSKNTREFKNATFFCVWERFWHVKWEWTKNEPEIKWHTYRTETKFWTYTNK